MKHLSKRNAQAEENKKRWYEERKQEVLFTRCARNMAFKSKHPTYYKVCAYDMRYQGKFGWETIFSSLVDETTKYFYNVEHAKNYYNELLNTIDTNEGTPIEVCLYESEIYADDILELTSYEEIKEIFEGTGFDILESKQLSPDYKSIEGSIIVVWEWNRYVGYARNFKSLEIGTYNETEEDLITGNEDYTFGTCKSLLISSEETKNKTDSELREILENELFGKDWKWTKISNIEVEIEYIIDVLKKIDMNKNNIAYYYYKGIEVVILYNYELEESGIKPVITECDMGVYTLTDELLSYMANNGIQPSVTTDDVYSGYSEPEEIIFATIQNPEDEQKLIEGWVRKSYAEMDEAHRELVVNTDRYYSWTSDRTRFINTNQGNINIEEMKCEWDKICARYSAPFDGDDISFDCLLDNIN